MAGVDRVYVDHASGATESRPALDEMLGQLRPGDTVVISRLDRHGRSLRHLIDLVAELEERGVGLRSLTESIDTSTPGGTLLFHVFGALADFERDLIMERTQAGLAAAHRVGRFLTTVKVLLTRTGARPSRPAPVLLPSPDGRRQRKHPDG